MSDHLSPSGSENEQKASLQQVLRLLRTRSDTSRFVGLSLLQSLLDANDQLRHDAALIKECWGAISNSFLKRLLKTGSSGDSVSCGANSMRELAVAVVHTFANLLDDTQVRSSKMLDLVGPIFAALPKLDAASQMLDFQALQILVSATGGAMALLTFGDHDFVREPTASDERYLLEYLKVFGYAWDASVASDARGKLVRIVIKTLRLVDDQDREMLLQILAVLAPNLELLSDSQVALFCLQLIHVTIKKRPTSNSRAAAIKLSSQILQRAGPENNVNKEFFSGKFADQGAADKPFSYAFIQYVLIDLRATIPSLMANLASTAYTTDSLRLANCFDVVSAFISFLIKSLDEPDTAAVMSPDLLLKIRRDLSETFSLTLEFFRDRWDAFTSGASGLEPSARLDPRGPPMLTWDNPMISPESDPIILSGLRALSLWIRENEDSHLEMQAMDILEMLGSLFMSSAKSEAKADFRHPVLVLLEGLLSKSGNAVQLLLNNDGWSILERDLHLRLKANRATGKREDCGLRDPALLDTIRVLLLVAESDSVPQSREAWMKIVKLASTLYSEALEAGSLEGLAGLWQLAAAIVVKAPTRLRKDNHAEIVTVFNACPQIIDRLESERVDQETLDSIKEVQAALSAFV